MATQAVGREWGHHALSPPQGLRGRSRSCGSASRRAMSHGHLAGRVWRHDALAPSQGQRGRSISCVRASRRATQAVSVGAMTLLSRTVAAGSHTRSASMSHVAALRANKRYSSGGGDGVAAVAATRAAVARAWILNGNVREFGVARETIRRRCLFLLILFYLGIRLPRDRVRSAK